MKLTKTDDIRYRDFWSSGEDAKEKIKQWPEWKRNIRVTKYSVGFDEMVEKMREK